MHSNDSANLTLEVFIRDLSGADRKICTWNLNSGTTRWTMEPFKSEWG